MEIVAPPSNVLKEEVPLPTGRSIRFVPTPGSDLAPRTFRKRDACSSEDEAGRLDQSGDLAPRTMFRKRDACSWEDEAGGFDQYQLRFTNRRLSALVDLLAQLRQESQVF